MKGGISLFVFILACLTTLCAQKSIPENVHAAFKTKFPNALKIKWGKESKTEYEADFLIHSQKMSANFSEAGEWLETESKIALDQLPQIVRQALNKAHAVAEVKSIEKVETNSGNKFEIKIKERNKTKEILFSEVGEEI